MANDHQPEGTQLVTQLGDVMGGPGVPADPETEAVDQRRKLWNLTRLGESLAGSENLNVRRCGEQILAVLGDAVLPVAAVLDPESAPVTFDTAGAGGDLRAVREFTSESGTYVIRYAPRDGVMIWTDRDYGQAACPVLEWLCMRCHVIFPPPDGARLTAPCPRCGSAMIPTSPALRVLEDMRTEIEVLRAAHRIAENAREPSGTAGAQSPQPASGSPVAVATEAGEGKDGTEGDEGRG